jgi:hypothetical protein
MQCIRQALCHRTSGISMNAVNQLVPEVENGLKYKPKRYFLLTALSVYHFISLF